MSTEERINNFIEYWGDKLANPDHHPIMFQYQLTLWKYYTNS